MRVLPIHEFKLTPSRGEHYKSWGEHPTESLKPVRDFLLRHFKSYFLDNILMFSILTQILLQLEKQQKKLESKGIMVEIGQLRLEWEAARNGGKGGNNEPIADHEIDVVGDDDSDVEETEGGKLDLISSERSSPTSSSATTGALLERSSPLLQRFTPLFEVNPGEGGDQEEEEMTKVQVLPRTINAFSIDNLLASRYRSLDSKINIKVEEEQISPQ